MVFSLQRRRVLLVLGVALLVVNIGNAAAHWLLRLHPSTLANSLEALFDLDREGNLSTLFNALLIQLSALLALMAAGWRHRRKESGAIGWAGAALVFAFLFIDELCGLHDSLDFLLAARIETSGAFSWPWVIAYGLLTLVVSAIFLPFFLRLPTAFKLRLGAAAFLYVSGAIGLEMAAANHVSSSGGEGAAYPFLVAVEENLEMGALLLVVDSLLAYLQRECRGFQLRIDAPEA